MPLELRSIIKDLSLGKINKDNAIKVLITLIENSENERIRISAIKVLGKIKLKTNLIFDVLEGVFISDSSEKIRMSAFEVLKKSFPIKSLKPISHAIQSEYGDFLVSLVVYLEENMENSLARNILIRKIKTFDQNYLNFILMGSKLESLDFINLKNIILNYLLCLSYNALYFHRHKIPLALDFYDLNFS